VKQFQVSILLALICVTALALAGRQPYVVEFRGRWRQTLGAFLLIGILAVAVLEPVTSFGEALEIEPETVWFPLLFAGHLMLAVFLLLWWRLRGDVGLSAFLHLSSRHVPAQLRRGLAAGCSGWLLTVLVTMTVGSMAAATGRVSPPREIPPLIVWLAELPIAYKLVIVAVAMTVEEAFFRGFLQPRFGLVVSSVLFALSHFSYGLPFMIVGVFTISLVIGRTFERTRALLPCIIAHGVFDAIQLLIILPWAVRSWTTTAV
jgi:membrane protease YdiL (CAAX protease family)